MCFLHLSRTIRSSLFRGTCAGRFPATYCRTLLNRRVSELTKGSQEDQKTSDEVPGLCGSQKQRSQTAKTESYGTHDWCDIKQQPQLALKTTNLGKHQHLHQLLRGLPQQPRGRAGCQTSPLQAVYLARVHARLVLHFYLVGRVRGMRVAASLQESDDRMRAAGRGRHLLGELGGFRRLLPFCWTFFEA